MSLLDDDILDRSDEAVKEGVKQEMIRKKIAHYLFLCGLAPRCFVTEEQVPFAERLERDFISFNDDHKERPLLSVDCRTLHKGDAYGWLKAISEGMRNGILNKPILVIENVDQIPDGDRNIYDDPQYVENILVRSWKNELINIGDFYLDRRDITVILTCSPDNQTRLGNACRMCSYAWGGEFEEWLEENTKFATEMVEKEVESEYEGNWYAARGNSSK